MCESAFTFLSVCVRFGTEDILKQNVRELLPGRDDVIVFAMEPCCRVSQGDSTLIVIIV